MSNYTTAETGTGLVGLPADDIKRIDGRSGLADRQVRTTRHSWGHLQDAEDSTATRRAGGKDQGRNSRGIQIR